MPAPTRTVDRSIAKMIAYKRIVTGSVSLCLAAAIAILGTMREGSKPLVALGFVIFAAGGRWTLRDGLRLRKELERDAGTNP
ncbi:hypothetical protein AKJ09_07322 [Labilithrix luteola]|uniref:Transmembrane protein n=1 Tax=Labilithrix luteola TaxID=1391654 RepID=A0A0K1Q4I8_9BACT|nr:hypothetical protein [Labilithrix luteola]AKV00659.1 hypothetical protein AKJ09_07322 [Labilithrix luteola]